MEEVSLHQRPSFRILILGLLLGGIYAYTFIWDGGKLGSVPGIVFDAILLFLLLQLAVFFYAQFTLPVHTLGDRLRISSRLWLHWRKAGGPAIFVKDGREVARAGETERTGPGLIWVDTASAVVTWSSLGHKAVLGPGVHFTETGQRIGRTFSLHTQTFTLGPNPEDPVFKKVDEHATEDQLKEHAGLEAARSAVSGHTRDGNEVVPNIEILFGLDSGAARAGKLGSRFGFSALAVERASRAEGIDATAAEGEQRRVAWNQLPGMMAIDLWREYLSKFTLDELFNPAFPPLPNVPQPVEPPGPIEMPSTPLIIKRGLIVRLLRQRNNAFEKWLEHQGSGRELKLENARSANMQRQASDDPGLRFTALQIVGQMVQLRLTQAAVPILDDCGRIIEGHTLSPEFAQLRERGLAVQRVAITSVRFDPSVEEQLIQHWNTGWLANAENERQQVEQLERLAAQNGRQSALVEHAIGLGQAIDEGKPADVGAAVKILLQATESEIVSNQRLYALANDEAESVASLIRWVESNQHD